VLGLNLDRRRHALWQKYYRCSPRSAPICLISTTIAIDQLRSLATLRIAPVANRVDASIVALRDALAHGRVLTQGGFPMRLVKFSRPVNGVVMVEYAELVDPDWILRQMERVKGETKKVRDLILPDDI
jgi:hypothetical protein